MHMYERMDESEHNTNQCTRANCARFGLVGETGESGPFPSPLPHTHTHTHACNLIKRSYAIRPAKRWVNPGFKHTTVGGDHLLEQASVTGALQCRMYMGASASDLISKENNARDGQDAR